MDLSARVARLEIENRRYKRAAAALASLTMLALLLGQARPESNHPSRTEELTIVDSKGDVRIRLHATDNEPAIEMTDAAGKAVVQITVPKVPDKPAFYLRDPQSGASIELALTMNGPVLHFYDKTGTRVRLAANELNAPLAAIYDERGRRLFEVSTDAKEK